MTTVITAEPRTYGPGSDNSYFQDIALTAQGVNAPGTREARTRLAHYDDELHVAIDNPTSENERKEGRRAAALSVERRRGNFGVEMRTGASSTSLAGFTTPIYLTDEFVTYNSPERSFLNQTTKLPLPEYGLQINVPSFTSSSTVAQQTENAGVSEGDPSGANIQDSIITQAGQITISQQLFDRGGMSGLAFDKIASKQLKSQLDAALDLYTLNQVLAGASVISGTSFSMANFYQNIASGREILTDTNGVRLAATHVFSTSDLFSYVTRQVDSQLRPIVTPDSSALIAAANDPEWLSWTGIHLPAALRWHTDDNIPAAGANTQIIVARPQEVFTFQGEPIAFAYPETNAQTLSVLVSLRAYVSVVVRFPHAAAVISGTAYPTSLV